MTQADPQGGDVRDVNGTKLRRLSAQGMVELGRNMMRAYTARVRENAREAGLDPQAVFKATNEADSRIAPKLGEIIQFILTFEGQVAAVELALAQARANGQPNAPATVDALGLRFEDALDLAVWCANLKLSDEKDEKAGDADADPFVSSTPAITTNVAPALSS